MSNSQIDTIRARLRQLPSLDGPLWPFPIERTPGTPQELFADWLTFAIDMGLREPHAMTLSTVDHDGCADARTLILKDLDESWYFASDGGGPKGMQIARQPGVALTFYWPRLGRQVRIRGSVRAMPAEASAQDFRARSGPARAMALASRQSRDLAGRDELTLALSEAEARLKTTPDLVSDSWTLYAVDAGEVEFWQGQSSRRHIRLLYRSDAAGWTKTTLWP